MTALLTLFVICLIQCFGNTGADIPKGYILKITPTCGSDYSGDGYVDIVTDLDMDAKAVCKGGKSVDFSTVDEVNFKLKFSYGTGGEPCIFSQRENSRVYFAKIVISYGEPDNEVHQYSEEYTVTCSFDAKGTNDSAKHIVGDTLIAAQEIQTNMGPPSKSPITLKLVDVLDNDLQSSTVHLGRMVRLEAETKGPEASIKPVSCNAFDSSSNAYAFLRAGCGEGIVLKKDEGFETTGKKAYSPYFKTFTVNGDKVVKFACNFTLCMKNCDSNSCDLHTPPTKPPPLLQRIKRDDREEPGSSLIASTAAVRLTGAPSDHAGVGVVEPISKN